MNMTVARGVGFSRATSVRLMVFGSVRESLLGGGGRQGAGLSEGGSMRGRAPRIIETGLATLVGLVLDVMNAEGAMVTTKNLFFVVVSKLLVEPIAVQSVFPHADHALDNSVFGRVVTVLARFPIESVLLKNGQKERRNRVGVMLGRGIGGFVGERVRVHFPVTGEACTRWFGADSGTGS